MPNQIDRYRATPSVLDRLVGVGQEDDDPYTLSRLREDVRRDIENLLNTRVPYLQIAVEEFPELMSSILAYGRPDLGMLKTNQEMTRFRQRLEDGIRNFEPRFHSVEVELVGLPTSTDRSLKLRIRSTLRVEPSYFFDFDSNMDMATGHCFLRIR